jgi:hypothetical protein
LAQAQTSLFSMPSVANASASECGRAGAMGARNSAAGAFGTEIVSGNSIGSSFPGKTG